MGLFDRLGGRPQQGEQKQVTPEMMRHEIGVIKADPGAYLKQYGYNIPEGMADPKEITQHLLQTGQVGGGRLQQVMRMLGALK